MYWRDALEAIKEICTNCGFLPSVMLEDEKSDVLLVLSQRGTHCYLTTVEGGWPDRTRPFGDRHLTVPVEEVDITLQRFNLPTHGWR